MKQSKTGKGGGFRDFYHLILFLIPGFHKFLLNRAMVSLVYEGLKLVPIYLLKIIIDDIFTQPVMKKEAMLIIGILLTFFIMTFFESFSFNSALRRIVAFQTGILTSLHKKLLELPMSFHERQRTGTIISKVNKAATYTADLLWFCNNDIIPIFFQTILTSTLIFMTEWRIGILYLAALLTLLWMINKSEQAVQPMRAVYHKIYDRSVGELAQSIYNVRTVKDYLQEGREERVYASLLQDYGRRVRKRWKMEMWFIVQRETCINAVRALTMGLAVWFVIKGQLTPGDLVLIFTLTEKAFINLNRLGRVYNFLGDTRESLSRARGILEEFNTLTEPHTPIQSKERRGLIEFKNVSFSYGEQDVLKNVSFAIPPQKIVAIIGASGAGKTTLIKLITRHYDPTTGAIHLDNIDLRKMSLKELRKKTAVVSQHTEIFNRTVHENIAYGKPTATRAQVREAAKKANAHEFIMSFKNGYDALVGEKGVRLSGGQQQRISIARALLNDPEILIFDEATSSLDSESEMGIQKAIFAVRGKYTLIIIAHRLSTVEHADLVIVLDKGHVAELGTHQELLRREDSLYKKMRHLQRLGELRP